VGWAAVNGGFSVSNPSVRTRTKSWSWSARSPRPARVPCPGSYCVPRPLRTHACPRVIALQPSGQAICTRSTHCREDKPHASRGHHLEVPSLGNRSVIRESSTRVGRASRVHADHVLRLGRSSIRGLSTQSCPKRALADSDQVLRFHPGSATYVWRLSRSSPSAPPSAGDHRDRAHDRARVPRRWRCAPRRF
jgi:hypothetical protein